MDLNTVRVERNTDPTGPPWRVLAGHTDDPTLIGYVQAAHTATGNRSSGRWTALTPHYTQLRGRARNRTEAIVLLLDNHQHAARV